MKAYTKADLDEVLRLHELWLANDPAGQRADLSYANLRSADLSSADLRSADLRYANLRSADLRSANLRSANLRSAELRYANLRSADLRSAELRYANLRSADLSYANLRSADLRSADLSSADLSSADLSSADLRSADLSYANLRSAELRSADLSSANLRSAELRSTNLRLDDIRSERWGRLWIAQNTITPIGAFTAFKKVEDDAILTLLVPADAKRLNAIGSRKIRVSKALVVSASVPDKTDFQSNYDKQFVYRIGEEVSSDFDERATEECSKGIHCFLTEEEAIQY